jgi:hypothetical protein
MKKRAGLTCAAAAAVAILVFDARASSAVQNRASTLKAEQALPLTCLQAWLASGREYPRMLDVVTILARVSLANRQLTFPNTREAGLDAGRGIADDCKADPNALLFAVVDTHVRRVAESVR